MIVLSPEGKAQTSAAKIAGIAQFTDLRGKVVGLLDNSKPNADKLAERFAELLKERYGVAGMITRRKLTDHTDHPRLHRIGKVRKGSFRRAGSSGAGGAASHRDGQDRTSESEGRRGI
jgi:hypothetical protein